MATTARPSPRRPTRTTFSDEIRDAIDRDGRTPYAIARDAQVDPGILSRFLAGKRSMTTDTLDRLAPALGLHLATATRGRGRPRAEAPRKAAPAPEPTTTPGPNGGD